MIVGERRDLEKVARLRGRLARLHIEVRQLEYELAQEQIKPHPDPPSWETKAIEQMFQGKGLRG